MALPPAFNAASAAVLARGLAVTTTADPRALGMPLLLGSLDSGSSRLIGAAAAERVLQRLSASSNALSWGGTAVDRLVSVLWLVRRTAGFLIKKNSRPLSPLPLDALKAPQPSFQEWLSRGSIEVASEPFLENSQEAESALILNENHSRMADDHAGASTTANASEENREQVPSPAPLGC